MALPQAYLNVITTSLKMDDGSDNGGQMLNSTEVVFMAQTTISKVLEDRLKGKNLSSIARELKISKSLLADWVAARRLPSLKNIDAVARLADYLGLSLEQMLLGRDTETKIISAVIFSEDERTYRIKIERIK